MNANVIQKILITILDLTLGTSKQILRISMLSEP